MKHFGIAHRPQQQRHRQFLPQHGHRQIGRRHMHAMAGPEHIVPEHAFIITHGDFVFRAAFQIIENPLGHVRLREAAQVGNIDGARQARTGAHDRIFAGIRIGDVTKRKDAGSRRGGVQACRNACQKRVAPFHGRKAPRKAAGEGPSPGTGYNHCTDGKVSTRSKIRRNVCWKSWPLRRPWQKHARDFDIGTVGWA